MGMRHLMVFMCIALACGCAGKGQIAAVRAGDGSLPDLAPRVHFPTAGTTVVSRDAIVLDHNAAELIQHGDAVVILEGHCDERGSEAFNLRLGDMRARSVMGDLIDRGVDPKRLIVLSKGEGEPLDGGRSQASWRRNRRVEFIIR